MIFLFFGVYIFIYILFLLYNIITFISKMYK
ncbi:hypothetical protein [Clostridium phage Amboise]|nr:hypothetical protein [Clostridium phage Amboise]DAH78986.1 MAG TPA: hypothetical protein [Caudoviricetes sp.]